MMDFFNKHKDQAFAVAFLAFCGAIAWYGGKALFSWVKFPFMVAIVVGIGFMLGNDGGHAVKRLLRDVIWPWVRTRLPW
jgi:hypothetical protein